jgi:hypothetical protein
MLFHLMPGQASDAMLLPVLLPLLFTAAWHIPANCY